MPRIASELKRLRIAQGLTQEQLGELAGVTKNTVFNLEKGGNAFPATVKLLAEALGVSYEQLLEPAERDAISQGAFSFRSRLQKQLALAPNSFPSSPEEVRDSATEMVSGFANSFQDSLEWADFQAAYDSLEEYTRLIIESYVLAWRRSSHSFLFAVESKERVALAANWPISDEAYELFRRGELAFFDFTEEMIEPGSQNILVNSAFEFPQKKKPFFEITDSLFHLILFQLGTQSRDAWCDSFRMVCFAGTPLNQKRAVANGFEPLGVHMPKVPFPLYEFRSIGTDNEQEDSFSKRILKGVVGAFTPSVLKRRALLSAVRAYQYAFAEHQQRRQAG